MSRLRSYPRGTTVPMEQRSIGSTTVGAIGLGAMPLSPKERRPSPADAEAVVHAALDAGVTLIDTADAYAADETEFGHNEELVARARASCGGGRPRAGLLWRGHLARAGGDQGRAHPARSRVGAGRDAGLPAPGLRGVRAPARGRGGRAVPAAPGGSRDAAGGGS